MIYKFPLIKLCFHLQASGLQNHLLQMLHFSCPVESSEEAMEAGETIPSTDAGTAVALLPTVAVARGEVRGVGRVAVASTAASSSSAVPTSMSPLSSCVVRCRFMLWIRWNLQPQTGQAKGLAVALCTSMCLSRSLLLGKVLEHLEHAKDFVSVLEMLEVATTLGIFSVVLGVIEMEVFCDSAVVWPGLAVWDLSGICFHQCTAGLLFCFFGSEATLSWGGGISVSSSSGSAR